MQIKITASVVISVVFACLASAAHADIISFTGTTAGGSTFNRPLEDLSALSAVGTSVAYNTTNFSVSTTGDYSFQSTANFDNFAIIYANTFNAASPLTNALVARDDLIAPPFTTAGFTAALTAGTDYVLLTTGFGNTDIGTFSNTIGGPGSIAAALGPPAPSNIFTFTGNTTGGPTFNRPLEDLSGLSAVGTNVSYSVFDLGVTLTGDYTFLTTSAFDGFALLYQNSCNPTAPLTNALVANDDLLAPPFTTSGFAAPLTAGTHYCFLMTGFGNTDFGAFSTTIGGPGSLVFDTTAVPEPKTFLLLGLGLIAIGFARCKVPRVTCKTRFVRS